MEMMPDRPTISRRRFLGFVWIASAALVVTEMVAGTFAFLWPRRKRGKVETVFIAGKAVDFKPGEVKPFRKEKAFVVRMEAGFMAMSATCPHLRCIVNWNEVLKKFECPCHGAKFNPSGVVIEGPPPRPLDLFKLEIVAGNVVVDTAKPIERTQFDPSQTVKV